MTEKMRERDREKERGGEGDLDTYQKMGVREDR